MKLWTMPQVSVEAFSANEYVAACSHEGGAINIQCDSHCIAIEGGLFGKSYIFENAENMYSGCGVGSHSSVRSPAYAIGEQCHATLSIPEEQWSKFKAKGTYFDANGNVVAQGAGSKYYIQRRRYGSGYVYLFDVLNNSGYAESSNHFLVGGAGGNPES